MEKRIKRDERSEERIKRDERSEERKIESIIKGKRLIVYKV